jgi:transcriptional regulator with XRE-family HTH domain
MNETNKSQSGECIRIERKRLGLSQAEAGQICGVARETWGKYERGVFEMGAAAFRAFVAAGADADFITTGHRTVSFESAAAQSTPAHMQPGQAGREAALLRHWRALPEPLQEQVSDLAETLANLYLRAGKD